MPRPRPRRGLEHAGGRASSAALPHGTAISSFFPIWPPSLPPAAGPMARRPVCPAILHEPPRQPRFRAENAGAEPHRDSDFPRLSQPFQLKDPIMRFTIKLKLGLSFGLIILLLTCAAGYAVMGLATMNNTMTALIHGPVTKIQPADAVTIKLLDITRAEKDIILETDPAKMQVYDNELTQDRQDFETLLDQGDQ